MCDVNWMLVLSPAPGLNLLALTEPWLHPTGQLASPRACDCCLEGLEGTNRKHTPHILTGGLHLTSHMCSWKTRLSRCVSWDITPWWLPPGNLARSLSFSSLALGHKRRHLKTLRQPLCRLPSLPWIYVCVDRALPCAIYVLGLATTESGKVWGVQGVTEGKGTNYIKAETGE